jgi:hypothetical protein
MCALLLEYMCFPSVIFVDVLFCAEMFYGSDINICPLTGTLHIIMKEIVIISTLFMLLHNSRVMIAQSV